MKSPAFRFDAIVRETENDEDDGSVHILFRSTSTRNPSAVGHEPSIQSSTHDLSDLVPRPNRMPFTIAAVSPPTRIFLH